MECTCRHVLVTVVVVFSIGFLCTVSEAASTAAAPPATEAVTGGTPGATENGTTENPTTVQASTANGTTKAVTTETGTVNGTDGTTQVITELATTVNGTAPAATTANNGTDAATTHKTPQTPGTDKPTSNPNKGSGSGFDAASFIGGIVLAAGVIAIGFFGFKFYKSRQEGKNYQQF